MTAPLTPPESDLQDFPFMPLHVARLRDSDLAAEEHPEACWYAVLLWSAAWHQLPAGSLPDNETVLTRLCGLGRDTKTFRKHRDAAMRGFVKCTDGRLYHPTVAEQVIDAWQGKLRQRWRTELARIKKANQRAKADAPHGYAELPSPTFEEFVGPDYVPPMSPVRAGHVPGDKPESPPGQPLQGTETGTETGTPKEEKDVFAEPKTPPASEGSKARKPRKKAAVGPAEFEAAWKAYPHVDGRSSKPKALEQWQALSADEQAGLVSAIERFKPKVAEICCGQGAPCMSRWLSDAKYLSFVSTASALPTPVFDGPPEVFASAAKASSQDFAQKWLPQCRWDAEGRRLVARNAFAAKKLRAELGPWAARNTVTITDESAQPDREAA